jgi:hypothetical protein
MLQLAAWLGQQPSARKALRRLMLLGCFNLLGATAEWTAQHRAWDAAMEALAAALQQATAAAGPAVTICNAPSVSPALPAAALRSPALQLQSLVISNTHPMQNSYKPFGRNPGPAAAPVLQHLSASTLTSLSCSLQFHDSQQLVVLYSWTALRSLSLWDITAFNHQQLLRLADSALTPFSAFKQLTHLALFNVRPAQLEHLQLPQLQELHVAVCRCDPEVDDAAQMVAPAVLQLSHFTSLTQLTVISGSLQDGDSLPSSLRELNVFFEDVAPGDTATCTLRPLLALTCLTRLSLRTRKGHLPISEAEVFQLCKQLRQLQHVCLKYGTIREPIAAAAMQAGLAPAEVIVVMKAMRQHAPICQ